MKVLNNDLKKINDCDSLEFSVFRRKQKVIVGFFIGRSYSMLKGICKQLLFFYIGDITTIVVTQTLAIGLVKTQYEHG